MGTSTDEARQAVAETRTRLEASLAQLEHRLRADLDVRTRLRREGPRLAAAASVVLVAAVAWWLQQRRRAGRTPPPLTAAEWFASMPPAWQAQLRELVELGGGSPPVPNARRPARGGGRPLWQQAALTSARIVIPRVLAARARAGGEHGRGG